MDTRTMVGGGAPPPPSEVKVRTMRSDLESMAKSGGGMPRFENVAVSGLSIEKESPVSQQVAAVAPAVATTVQPVQPIAIAESPVSEQTPNSQQTEPTHKDMYPMFIIAVVAILAIGGVGYVAYITFFASPSAPTTVQTNMPTAPVTLPAVITATSTPTSTASSSGAAATGQSSAALPGSMAELSTAHISLFKKPADQVIALDFGTTNASTYDKTMSSALSTASAASSMIEINPKASDGNNLSIQGLLSVAGGSILPSSVWADFNPDATFFVYRDKNGLWPGYVVALNAGETTSSVAASVAQLESSNNIANLFLTNPGTQSGDGFTGSIIAGIPVRILPFTGLSAPSYFTYGWDGNYLILSTSQNGFGAAVANLQ